MTVTAGDMLGDFADEIQRLRVAAPGSAGERQALNAAVGDLYSLREHFRIKAGGDSLYFATARSSAEGRVTEALVLLRGRAVHNFTSNLAPEQQPTVPGPNLYPSPDLFPGSNLAWLPGQTVKATLDPKGTDPRFPDYDSAVGGLPVLQTLNQAMTFFRSLP